MSRPRARRYREQVESADAAAAKHRYEESRLATGSSEGEMTFGEVLQQFHLGKVYRSPDLFPGSAKFNEGRRRRQRRPVPRVSEPPGASSPRSVRGAVPALALDGYADEGDPRKHGADHRR